MFTMNFTTLLFAPEWTMWYVGDEAVSLFWRKYISLGFISIDSGDWEAITVW